MQDARNVIDAMISALFGQQYGFHNGRGMEELRHSSTGTEGDLKVKGYPAEFKPLISTLDRFALFVHDWVGKTCLCWLIGLGSPQETRAQQSHFAGDCL